MIKSILVALDGSQDADDPLPPSTDPVLAVDERAGHEHARIRFACARHRSASGIC